MSDEIYGNPQQESQYWVEQTAPEDCVEMSTADVVGQLTGDEPSEAQITTLAEDTPSEVHSGDVYNPESGTYLPDAVELLAHYGVSAQYYSDEDASSPSGLSVLEKALASGGKPIVAVDGQRIWDAIGDQGGPDPGDADHAVVVTGIDTETGMVYLNDSGAPHGAEEAVPLDVFLSAWATSGHSMVVADPSGSAPGPSPSPAPATSGHTVDDNPFVPPGEDPAPNTMADLEGRDLNEGELVDAGLAALGAVGAAMAVLSRRRRGAAAQSASATTSR
jgi:Peptidase_C39 like family